MIRNASLDDVNEILKLEKKYFKFPRQNIDFEDFFVDDQLRGYIDIKTVLDEGYIGNIVVDEQFRRQGIADQLIEFSFNKANENNLSFLTLEVRESNYPAISLYLKHGFKKEGILKNHYINPKENAIIMTVRRPF